MSMKIPSTSSLTSSTIPLPFAANAEDLLRQRPDSFEEATRPNWTTTMVFQSSVPLPNTTTRRSRAQERRLRLLQVLNDALSLVEDDDDAMNWE